MGLDLGLTILPVFRIILETAEVGHWVEDSHLNSNGAASIETSQVQELFNNSDPSVINQLVRRYYPDFKICGYDDTLSDLRNFLRWT